MKHDFDSSRRFQAGETVYLVRDTTNHRIVVEKGTVQQNPHDDVRSDELFVRKWPSFTQAPSGIRINHARGIDTVFAPEEVVDAANQLRGPIQPNADEALLAHTDRLTIALAAIVMTREIERALQNPA